MIQTTKKIASGTLWLARGTSIVLGLAVMLAVALGVGTTALAAVPGDPFKLGRLNAVNAVSVLAGSVDNAALRVTNGSEGQSATALDLRVKPGKPPMVVNSSTEVQGLNVDQVDSKSAGDFLGENETAFNSGNLDGKDSTSFFSGKTYKTIGSAVSVATGNTGFAKAQCDPGDAALGGGYNFGFSNSATVFSAGTSGGTYSVGFAGPRIGLAEVTCADFPPLRSQ